MSGAVVVPTFGRAELLRPCLASLAALDPAPPAVFLVDGNARPVALPPAAPANLVVIREPNRGPAHARNTGLAAARDAGADVVCFTDDDAVVPPDWYGRHMGLHGDHPEAGAVGGPTSNLRAGSAVADYTHLVVFGEERADPGPVRTIPSVNVSYKVACLDQVGSFPEELRLPGGEEVDLNWRIVQAGWTVFYQPDLIVGHHFATSWKTLIRQQRAYGRGFVQTRRRWPEMPGAEFMSLPWWRAVAGTAPHVARQAYRTGREQGARLVPVSIVRELVFRSSALAERRRSPVP